MSISPIFMFAPIPLTSERSPLAHAAEVARRRLAESQGLAAPRYRTKAKTRVIPMQATPAPAVAEPAVA